MKKDRIAFDDERELLLYEAENRQNILQRQGGYFFCNRAEQIAQCYFCSKEIYGYEDYYILDAVEVCGDYDCRYAAFSANADGMLLEFALEWELLGDAMDWFFETYAKKGREE